MFSITSVKKKNKIKNVTWDSVTCHWNKVLYYKCGREYKHLSRWKKNLDNKTSIVTVYHCGVMLTFCVSHWNFNLVYPSYWLVNIQHYNTYMYTLCAYSGLSLMTNKWKLVLFVHKHNACSMNYEKIYTCLAKITYSMYLLLQTKSKSQ